MDCERLFISALHKSGVLLGVGDDAVLLQDVSRISPRIHFFTPRIKSPKYGHLQGISSSSFARVLGKHKELFVAADGFCEHIHFKREWLSLEEIATKAMLINISDMFAMNALPKYALLSVTLPHLQAKEITQIAQALANVARSYNVKLIGGDTMKGESLAFHITMLGVPNGKILGRKGLKAGDLVYCTGRVGQSLYALLWLLRGGKIAHSRRFARFIAPCLRDQFIAAIAPFARVGLDVSDGVLRELHTLSALNHLRFSSLTKSRIPAYKSGEEYELLFAIAPRHKHRLLRVAKRTRTPLEFIAKAKRIGSKLPRARIWH